MLGRRLSVFRVVLLAMAWVILSDVALAEECDYRYRKVLPKCASWQRDPVTGVEFRNRCRFPVAFVVVSRQSPKGSVTGRAEPDETVIAAQEIERAQVGAVYCCSDLGAC
jgi:hypothetical protein